MALDPEQIALDARRARADLIGLNLLEDDHGLAREAYRAAAAGRRR